MKISYAARVAGVAGSGQDRVRVLERAGGIRVVLADGAGGTGNGAAVADFVVEAASAYPGDDWAMLFDELDKRASRIGGQSTAVVVAVGADVRGASVGDSGAWIIDSDRIVDLTYQQERKPLVGDGCMPVAFEPIPLGAATLLLASDGLLKYARQEDIARIARGADLERAVDELVDLVRLASSTLQDDVSVVLCRAAASS